jgi:hypothetical protein
MFTDIFVIFGAASSVGQHFVNVKCLYPEMSEVEVFLSFKVIWAIAPLLLMMLSMLTWITVHYTLRKINCRPDHPSFCCRASNIFPSQVTNLYSKISISNVALLSFMWPSICKETFELFACQNVCDDNFTFLRADLDVKCFHGMHLLFALGVGVPMLLLYVIGLPIGSFYRVWKVQHALRGLQQRTGVHASQLQQRVNIKHRSLHYDKEQDDYRVWGMFISAFHKSTWWWEYTIAGRKIIIAFLGVFGATLENVRIFGQCFFLAKNVPAVLTFFITT